MPPVEAPRGRIVHSRAKFPASCSAFLVFCALEVARAAPRSAQRVVSLTVGNDELLLDLADPAQIVALSYLGRDRAVSLKANEAATYPKLKSRDAESVMRFRPDLVLVARYTDPATLALLRRAGVKLIVVERFESLEDVYANIRTIGAALGHPERAEALIVRTKQRVAELGRKLEGVKPVRVLAVSTYPFTAGSQTTFQDLCDHAGAINVAAEAGLVGYTSTPAEKLLTWNPELLIASDSDGPDLQGRLRHTPAYRHLPALKAGRLVVLPGPLMTSVTHHRVEAFEALARKLHPERFR
jgi:iron complex transport system substrate-binding protein